MASSPPQRALGFNSTDDVGIEARQAKGAVRRRWGLIAACGLLVSALLAIWFSSFNPITGLGPDRDSGIFLYIGQQLLNGQVLYRDLFDGKGPLLYLFNALGLLAGGGSMWGVYVLYIVLLSLTFVLVLLGLQHRFGLLPGAGAALYGVLLLSATTTHVMGNNADGYMVSSAFSALCPHQVAAERLARLSLSSARPGRDRGLLHQDDECGALDRACCGGDTRCGQILPVEPV